MSYKKTQKDNSTKSRKQHTNKIRNLTRDKNHLKKKNHMEFLELTNMVNEMKKYNRECQYQEWINKKKKL